MSPPDVSRPVSVGVADDQRAALSFAAEQARALECDLRVIHAYVVPPSPPRILGTQYGFDVEAAFRSSGQEVLDRATSFVAAQHREITVRSVLERGLAPTVLTGCSATSQMVVLGPDDDTPWYSRLFQGRVSRSLVSEAFCPVVVVPDSWRADAWPQVVTLLLDGQSVAHGPLQFAFDQASHHGFALHIVHVKESDEFADPAIPWHDLSRLIDSWQARNPDVRVHRSVVPGTPDLGLVEAFERTGLLVIGRPHQSHAVAAMHRSLARAVVERASCAVAVVPADHQL